MRRAFDLAFWPVVIVLAVALPPLYDDSYVMAELVLFGIYFAINLMWSLVLGTAGLYSFATLAFVGAAAYSCAWLSINHSLPWWLYAPVGMAVGAVAGLLVALPAVRLRGVYFALLTIGLVEACNQYVTGDTANLGGAQGLVGADSIIPPSKQGLIEGYYYAYAAIGVIVIVALLVYWWVSSGRLGLRLRTARESEPVAQALGIDIPRARLAVFVITAAVLGLVGAFRASYDAGANKSVFDFSTLLLLFAMIVVGGINSPKGILLGTALLQFIEQHYVSWGAPRLILLGAIMLLITLFTTDGLAGIPDQIGRALRGRGAPAADDAAPAAMGGGTMTEDDRRPRDRPDRCPARRAGGHDLARRAHPERQSQVPRPGLRRRRRRRGRGLQARGRGLSRARRGSRSVGDRARARERGRRRSPVPAGGAP